MKYLRFGTTKRNVSVIGQGTWYLDEVIERMRSPHWSAVSTSA